MHDAITQITASGRRLITKRELLAMVPLKSEAIRVREKRGEFPKRIFLSTKTVVWELALVERWLENVTKDGVRDFTQLHS